MNNGYREPSRKPGTRNRLSALLDRVLRVDDRDLTAELHYEVQLDAAWAWSLTPEGWVIGLELSCVNDEWCVTEIDLRPRGIGAAHPVVDSLLIEAAIAGVKARALGLLKLQRGGEEQLRRNGAFIRANLAACRDRNHRKTNFDFAAIAAAYAGEVQAGNRKATQSVASLLGTTTAVTAQWVKEARKRRLLTPGEPGRASGSLSPLGALYTSPDFPGFGEAWRSGTSVENLAELHGVSVRDVWTGLDGEGYARSISVWVENMRELNGGSKET